MLCKPDDPESRSQNTWRRATLENARHVGNYIGTYLQKRNGRCRPTRTGATHRVSGWRRAVGGQAPCGVQGNAQFHARHRRRSTWPPRFDPGEGTGGRASRLVSRSRPDDAFGRGFLGRFWACRGLPLQQAPVCNDITSFVRPVPSHRPLSTSCTPMDGSTGERRGIFVSFFLDVHFKFT